MWFMVKERKANETRNTDKTMNATTLDTENSLEFIKAIPAVVSKNRDVAQPEPAKSVENGSNPKAGGSPKRNNHLRHLVTGLSTLVASLAMGNYYLKSIAPFESTDDAFIEAHVTPVAPQVSGRVAELFVQDNQMVAAGETLLAIDPSDYQTKLDQERAALAAAESRLEQAHGQFAVDQAKVEQEKATVSAAQAEAKQAASDNLRYQAVGNSGVSESRLDLAKTQARTAEAQVDSARNRELAAEAQSALDKTRIQTATAEVENSKAAVRQAELNLSYTRVKATEAGYITHRSVESGSYVQTGQSLLAVVPRQVWVVANFKETQLANMRPGQPVEIKVDAYPHLRLKGHVDSIQSGTGPRFSLLPPENASGNYVKVVQRVPVKIVLDGTGADNQVLGPGMSVVPEVRVK